MLKNEYLLFACKDQRRYSRERARSSKSMKYQLYLYFLCWAQAAVPVEAEAEELAHVREDAVHDVREAPTVDFGGKRARAGVGAKPCIFEKCIFENAFFENAFFENAFFENAFFEKFANCWRARSRLYQNEILQETMRLTAFFKLYKMCTLLHRCDLKILAKIGLNNQQFSWKFSNF